MTIPYKDMILNGYKGLTGAALVMLCVAVVAAWAMDKDIRKDLKGSMTESEERVMERLDRLERRIMERLSKLENIN